MIKYKDPQYATRDVLREFKSGAEVARLLNVTRQSICNWPKDGNVPPLQAYRLQQIKPEVFK